MSSIMRDRSYDWWMYASKHLRLFQAFVIPGGIAVVIAAFHIADAILPFPILTGLGIALLISWWTLRKIGEARWNRLTPEEQRKAREAAIDKAMRDFDRYRSRESKNPTPI